MDALKVLSIIALTLFIMVMLGTMSVTGCLGGAAVGSYYANQDVNNDAKIVAAVHAYDQHSSAPSSDVESMMLY